MKNDLRIKPRFLSRIWAFMGGYFWLPCPICRENFGGHEWGTVNGYPIAVQDSDGHGKGVCQNCVIKALEINQKNGYRNF